MKSVLDFAKSKSEGKKISMITCYDYWTAQIVNASTIDCILVGDSLAMVCHGYENTIPADIEIMSLHTSSVAKGAKSKFIIGDLPFLSYRKSLSNSMSNIEKLLKAGAHAIKLEGILGNENLIKHIVQSGIPVMAHLGLTPQSVHQLGGFRVQGKTIDQETQIFKLAKTAEELGCFSVVLECIPTNLADKITNELSIPTIGIGAGSMTDGQVLVMQDMLGMNRSFKTKFVREYLNGHNLFLNAFNSFDKDVKANEFPNNLTEAYL